MGAKCVFILLETVVERRIFAQVILNYGAVLADENIAAFSHATQGISTLISLVVPCCMHFVLICIVYQNNYYKYYRNHQNVLKFDGIVEFFE